MSLSDGTWTANAISAVFANWVRSDNLLHWQQGSGACFDDG
jgi:hypothetical protein